MTQTNLCQGLHPRASHHAKTYFFVICRAGGEWYLCDDGWVGHVPASEVRTSQAFQLFYARTNLAAQPLS